MKLEKVLKIILNVLLLEGLVMAGILFYSYISYDSAITTFADRRIIIQSETRTMVDRKEELIITKRVLAAQEFSNYIYALSRDGFIIYDLKNKSVKVYEGQHDGLQEISSTEKRKEYMGYHQPAVVEISNYDDFTPEEKSNFENMLSSRERSGGISLFYVKPFYETAYDSMVVDVKQLVELTRCYEYSIQGDKIYIYGGNNFTLLNSSTGKIIQYYNDKLGTGLGSGEQTKKEIYGDQITFLSSPREFSAEDLLIFKVLREQGLRGRYYNSSEKLGEYLSIDLKEL